MTSQYLNNPPRQRGFVIVCDKKWIIKEVLLNSFFDDEILKEGNNWKTVLDEQSYEKAQIFEEKLQKEGVLLNWELNIVDKNDLRSIRYAGVKLEKDWLIIADTTNEGLTKLMEEYMRIGNEQALNLRLTVKENTVLKKRMNEEKEQYDEISRLNNELVNTQRELTKKNVELEKLMTLKNRFIGIAAHDLRNPLSNIFSFTQLLSRDQHNLSDQQLLFLKYITQSSQHMLALIEDLLDVSSIEEGSIRLNLQEVNFVQFLNELIYVNQLQANKKNIKLDLKTQLKKADILIDKGKMEQVLNNLITNAIKYSHEHTVVTIGLDRKENKLICSVKDEGLGINDEEIKHLFEAFQTTSNKATAGEKSTGLGLYITKRLINAHRGDIWVESSEGKGSVFYFSLNFNNSDMG